MSSLGDLYTHLKTLCEQWFYNKSTIDSYLNNKISKSSTVGLVKNDGSIDTNTYLTNHQDITGKEDKSNKVSSWSGTTNNTHYPSEKLVKDSLDTKLNISDAFSGSYNDLTNKPSTFEPSEHTHSDQQIDTYYPLPNLGLGANARQSTVNQTIDNAIGYLSSIKAIEVVSTRPTASIITMGKLYIISESNKVNVYYTEENNGSYSWHKMDADILDELSIAWNDITDKPSTFTPSNHTHGNISNDGKITTRDGNVLGYRYYPIIALDDGSLIQGHIQTGHIYDSFGRTNIGTSANSSLTTIMTAIDTALGNKANTSDLGAVALSNSYDDLDDLPTLFTGDYNDLTNKPNIPSGVVVDTSLDSSSNNAIANSTVTTALNGKVDSNDSRLTDARTPTSHSHGYLQNGGTLTQTGTNNGSIVVTNSSNKIVVQSKIDVLDAVIQDLISYGSS